MNPWTRILKRLVLFAWTGLFWLAGTAALWAKQVEEEAEGPKASWTMSYILVVLAIGLGLVVICRPGRRSASIRPPEQ